MTTQPVREEVDAHVQRFRDTVRRLQEQMRRNFKAEPLHSESGPWYPAKCGDVRPKADLSKRDGDNTDDE